MQIHELNNFTGTPTSTDYLAIDNSTTTTKIGATGLGVQDQLTVAEANTGTSTASRIVTPKVVHDYVVQDTTHITSATKSSWATITGNDGSIDDIIDYMSNEEKIKTFTPSFNPSTGSVVDTSVIQYGRICSLNLTITKTTATSAGSNMFAGTMTDAPLPVNAARFVGYAGSAIVVAHLNTDGSISGRVVGAQISANANVGVAGIYMTSN